MYHSWAYEILEAKPGNRCNFRNSFFLSAKDTPGHTSEPNHCGQTFCNSVRTTFLACITAPAPFQQTIARSDTLRPDPNVRPKRFQVRVKVQAVQSDCRPKWVGHCSPGTRTGNRGWRKPRTPRIVDNNPCIRFSRTSLYTVVALNSNASRSCDRQLTHFRFEGNWIFYKPD